MAVHMLESSQEDGAPFSVPIFQGLYQAPPHRPVGTFKCDDLWSTSPLSRALAGPALNASRLSPEQQMGTLRMIGRSCPGFGVSLDPRAGLLMRFEHVKDLEPSRPRSGCSPVSKTRQSSPRTRPKANACRPRSVPVPVEAVLFGARHIAALR